MIVIGLTGSIAMGKSTAAKMLTYLGVPVHDADKSVHKLLGPNGSAVKQVANAFPTAFDGQAIDRKVLGSLVFGNPDALSHLESILHPQVHRLTQKFLRDQQRSGRSIVALDIPLLFETHGQDRVDSVFVVSAPASVQRQRVLARPGMTPERLSTILNKQMSDQLKRRQADYVIPTGLGKQASFRTLQQALRQLGDEQSVAFPNQSYKTRHPNFARIF